jgi:hypothetical protein
MNMILPLLVVACLPLAAQTGSSPMPRQKPADAVLSPSAQTMGKDSVPLVGREVLLVESPGLSMDVTANPDAPISVHAGSSLRSAMGSKDPAIEKEDNVGTQFYRFNVEPGEIIAFTITCEDGDYVTQKYVLMQGRDLVPGSVSKAQETRALRIAPRLRAKDLSFHNLEGRVLPLMLVVYGETGHAFRIWIKRTH